MIVPKGDASGGVSPFGTLSDRAQLSISLLPGATALIDLHARELPQKDELCGPFWAMLALRAAGLTHAAGAIDQDAVAAAAGTTISPDPVPAFLPNGEPGRRDFRLILPATPDPARSGTAPGGLVRAVSHLSGGRIAAVALTGAWDPAALRSLVEIAAGAPTLALVANVETGKLWGSRPRLDQALAHLESGELDGPPPDWSVGHFLAILGLVHGRAGTLAVVADTYSSLGWSGIHLQPLPLLGEALHRDGEGRGGVLLVAPASEVDPISDQAVAAGLQVGPWDNGSDDGPGS